MDQEETKNVFRPEYRELSDGEKAIVDDFKDKAFELFKSYEDATTNSCGRQLAIAKTKLEESVMWAVKDITA